VEKTQNQLIDNGVWLRPYGKFLYTMPPFIITDNELSIITNTIKTIINK
jgi:adenosylmethionine-8-amino-7-oxononanoate aminotransferase